MSLERKANLVFLPENMIDLSKETPAVDLLHLKPIGASNQLFSMAAK